MATWRTCQECSGSGYIECLKCLGTGADIDTDAICRHCDGEGAFDCDDCEAIGGFWTEGDNGETS